jgi:hypothetical protein
MHRSLAIVAVLVHLLVTMLHGHAHTELRVGLSEWQQIFVIGVILVAPLIAAGLLLTRYARLGLWLLAISMAGSLIFGVYFHYSHFQITFASAARRFTGNVPRNRDAPVLTELLV